MITTIVLANTCIMSHNYHFFFVVNTLKIYSHLSKFQVYNTVLSTIITMLYMNLLILQLEVYALGPTSPLFHPPQPLAPTILECFYAFSFFRFHICK